MSDTRVRDKQIKVYVTERKRTALKRKAEKSKLTVSEYARQSLIHSSNLSIIRIDITPFDKTLFELRKQGANLNQLVKYLNTYGADAYEKDAANRVYERLGVTYQGVTGALIKLRREAEKHKVVIDFECHLIRDDED